MVIERDARRDTERLGGYEVARQKYTASQMIYCNEGLIISILALLVQYVCKLSDEKLPEVAGGS